MPNLTGHFKTIILASLMSAGAVAMSIIALALGFQVHVGEYTIKLLTGETVAAAIACVFAYLCRKRLPKLPNMQDRNTTWFLWAMLMVLPAMLIPTVVRAILDDQTLFNFALVILFSFAVGITEELIFRFILLRRLLVFGAGFALIFSSLTFGLLHMSGFTWVAAANCIPQITVGACLGMIYLFSGKIWHAICAHALWDVALLGSVMLPNKELETMTGNPDAFNPAVFFFAVPLLALWWTWKMYFKNNPTQIQDQSQEDDTNSEGESLSHLNPATQTQ